jgi:hypothetical protein
MLFACASGAARAVTKQNLKLARPMRELLDAAVNRSDRWSPHSDRATFRFPALLSNPRPIGPRRPA